MKFAIVIVDYYTKWAEASVLATITEANCTSFISNNIICRFGVPHSIVFDNSQQFHNARVIELCESLGIHKDFSTLAHPQANSQVEAINKIIKEVLKKRLDNLQGKWTDELPNVLWAYRTTSRSTIGETPFSLSFGMEAVIPIEFDLQTAQVAHFDDSENDARIDQELDLLKERREIFQICLANY